MYSLIGWDAGVFVVTQGEIQILKVQSVREILMIVLHVPANTELQHL